MSLLVQAHVDGWVVVDEKTFKEVAVYPHRATADAHAQQYNKRQALNAIMQGGGEHYTVMADDRKRGCTCGRGIMLPGDKPCPVHT